MPIAWMIYSNATEVTITFFLRALKAKNPTYPKIIMTDKDQAQINSIRTVYPDTKILLCWWHVLHVWQQHFVTAHHPTLWKLLKEWVRISNLIDFKVQWVEIKKEGPQSVIEYLEKEWMGDHEMWSAIARTDCVIWELRDTNMLLEA